MGGRDVLLVFEDYHPDLPPKTSPCRVFHRWVVTTSEFHYPLLAIDLIKL